MTILLLYAILILAFRSSFRKKGREVALLLERDPLGGVMKRFVTRVVLEFAAIVAVTITASLLVKDGASRLGVVGAFYLRDVQLV